MTAKTQRVAEAFDLQDTKIDPEKGVIHQVLLLGPKSRNGREYTPQALSQAVSLFENRPVNLSHSKQMNPSTGKMEPIFSVDLPKRFGWISGVTSHPEGLRGSLNVLKTHPFSHTVFEAAERMPSMFCFSPVFDVVGAEDNPNKIVQIEKVYSIDLVSEGGTTRTLFEESEEKPAEDEALHEEEVEELEGIETPLRHLIEQVTAELVDFHHEHKDTERATKRVGQHLRHHHRMHLSGETDGKEEKEDKTKDEELHTLKAQNHSYRVCEQHEVPMTPDLLTTLTALGDGPRADELRDKHVLDLKRQRLLHPAQGPNPALLETSSNGEKWENRLRMK